MARRAEIDVLLSDRRVELASPKVVAEYVADLQAVLSGSALTERKTFIKSFVKKVRVKDEEVVLTYTMPIADNGTKSSDMAVLSSVQYGGR